MNSIHKILGTKIPTEYVYLVLLAFNMFYEEIIFFQVPLKLNTCIIIHTLSEINIEITVKSLFNLIESHTENSNVHFKLIIFVFTEYGEVQGGNSESIQREKNR